MQAQVLAELAVYRAPTMAAGGQYVLRREMWEGWDPHFPHYTRRSLARAWEKAIVVGHTLVFACTCQALCMLTCLQPYPRCFRVPRLFF